MNKPLLAAAALLLLSSTAAHALEGKALFDKIAADADAKVTYEAADEADGDTVTLTNLRIEGGDTNVTVGKLVLDGFRENGDVVELDASSSENVVYEFPIDAAARRKNPDGKASMKVSSGTSADFSGPAAVILSMNLEGLSGRFKMGSYALDGIEADFDGDGTFETTMSRVALEGLDTPLEFRYTKEQLDAAEGPAPEPLKLDSLAIDGTRVATPTGELSLGDFKLDALVVPATVKAAPQEWSTLYRTASIGPVAFTTGGAKPYSFEKLSATIEPAEGGVIRSKSVLEGMFVDLSAIGDARLTGFANALGYSELKGRMTGDGVYDFASGEVSIDDVTIDLDDVAALSVAYKMTGYTPDFVTRMNELSLNAAATAQDGKAAQPDPAAMMKLLGELKLESAKVSLKDDSIVGRALKFQAAQMKTSPEQLAAGAPMFVGMGMAQLGAPEFTQQVSAAIGSFLQNPGTLTVSAVPAEPVPLLDVVGASQRAPKAVIDLLNVKVEATQ